MPVVIGADHLEGPTSIDILAWTALALVVARVGRTGNLRVWLVGGLVLGVGLANKHSVGFFALAIFAGALARRGLASFRGQPLVGSRGGSPSPPFFTIPDLWWQASHGWPTIAMTRSLNQQNGGAPNVGRLDCGPVDHGQLWHCCGCGSLECGFLWALGKAGCVRALVWAYGLAVRVLRCHHRGQDLLPGRALTCTCWRPGSVLRRGLVGGPARGDGGA